MPVREELVMQQNVRIGLRASSGGLLTTVDAGPALPLSQMLIGRAVDDVVSLLPRVFNLCRSAQEGAARLALGMPLNDAYATQLARELLRDHLIKFCLTWPRLLSLPSQPLPSPEATLTSLFGSVATMPADLPSYLVWLHSESGMAPVLRGIAEAFAPGEACVALPMTHANSVFSALPQDNSPALRHREHPVLQGLLARYGAGPLWRATARLIDAEACYLGGLPPLQRLADGTALAPAARGVYAVRASAIDGRLVAFQRVTPTDHLFLPDGMLSQSFASLPPAKKTFAALLLDILDPCVPCQLEEIHNA